MKCGSDSFCYLSVKLVDVNGFPGISGADGRDGARPLHSLSISIGDA